VVRFSRPCTALVGEAKSIEIPSCTPYGLKVFAILPRPSMFVEVKSVEFALTLSTMTPLMPIDAKRWAYWLERVKMLTMLPFAKKMEFPAKPCSMLPSMLSHLQESCSAFENSLLVESHLLIGPSDRSSWVADIRDLAGVALGEHGKVLESSVERATLIMT